MFSGSEEGWRNASHDSRRGDKQRDIRSTVDAMQAATKKREKDWEAGLEDAFMDATLESILKGGGDRSILHGGDRYRANFENWIRSLK